MSKEKDNIETTENEKDLVIESPILDPVVERSTLDTEEDIENEFEDDEQEESDEEGFDYNDDDDEGEFEDDEGENETIPVSDDLVNFGTDFVKGILNSALPNASHAISKIPTEKILPLEIEGRLKTGSVALLEAQNDKNLETFKRTTESITPFFEAPLAALSKEGKVNLKPETMLIVLAVALVGMLGFQTIQARKSNNLLVAQILEGAKPKEVIQESKEIQPQASTPPIKDEAEPKTAPKDEPKDK